MTSRRSWVLLTVIALVLTVGSAIFLAMLIYVWIPLSIAPLGYTLEQLRSLGAAYDLNPFGILFSHGLFLAVTVWIVWKSLRGPGRGVSHISGFGRLLLLLGTVMAISWFDIWGSGFATADYFSGGGGRADGLISGYCLSFTILLLVGTALEPGGRRLPAMEPKPPGPGRVEEPTSPHPT